ncbi:hypothetical protein [Halpernia sp.]|uniref:hypothetical protein n=1 Tax=Halpernia sp. TaxID=2782209 RepID=UPI003A925ED6
MKIKNLLLLLLTLFLIISCRKDEELTIKEKLNGKWNWENSTGGMNGKEIHTPQSEGYTMQYNFKSNDSISITKNETLKFNNTKYHLTREKSILFQKDFDFLTIDYKFKEFGTDSIITLPMRYMINKIDGNSLELTEDVYDGYSLKLKK